MFNAQKRRLSTFSVKVHYYVGMMMQKITNRHREILINLHSWAKHFHVMLIYGLRTLPRPEDTRRGWKPASTVMAERVKVKKGVGDWRWRPGGEDGFGEGTPGGGCRGRRLQDVKRESRGEKMERTL
jgi:hypothetical protein